MRTTCLHTWKENKTITNPLHKLCSRIGSFPPALPRYFIHKYSKKGDVFLDSFSGKGTAPLEAAIFGMKSIGNDISPEAFIITNAKLNPISLDAFNNKLDELKYKMGFMKSTKGTGNKVRVFFHPYTLKQILEMRQLLENDKSKEANFIKATMLGILHGSSAYSLSVNCSHSYTMSPNYVKKYAEAHNLKRPKRNVIECLKAKAKTLLENNTLNFEGTALNTDARNLPLKDASVDLSLFSPPYLNVQTYAYDNWLRLWFLGYDYKEVSKKIMQSSSLDTYKQFMDETLKEIYRLLKTNGRCFIIVGDVTRKSSNGKKQTINIAKHLKNQAEKIGFKCNGITTDFIPPNKKYMPQNKQCGIKTERILHLKK